MATEINPQNCTLASLLSGKTYMVDFYQRDYVWSKETVDVLLRDIFHAFEQSYEKFKEAEMTAAVLAQYNWYYLNVVITNSADGMSYIVDGQQRLTTLTLLAAKLLRCTDNKYLTTPLTNCICSVSPFGEMFSIDHERRKEAMRSIMDDGARPEKMKDRTEKNLFARYDDISRFVDDKAMPQKKLEAFIHYFLNRLILVELQIQHNDTPMVFEAINDRGEALRPFEILKGKMVGSLDKHDTMAYSDKWDAVMRNLEGMEDVFFADYLKAKFVFSSNTSLEKTINNAYHRYIFGRNHVADSLRFRNYDLDAKSNIKGFIDRDFTYYGGLYSKARRNTMDDEFIGYYDSILNLSGLYRVMMAACETDDRMGEDKVRTLAKEYERLYVLLVLNGVYNSNEFQNISLSLNKAVRGKGVGEYRAIFNGKVSDAVTERRGTSGSSILDYNAFLRVGYTTLDKKFLRYLFARVEKYVCDVMYKGKVTDVKFISNSTGKVWGYHVEHILSRNAENMGYFASEEEFDVMRNTLGGLLLLRNKDNEKSGNELYVNKLKTYSSSGLIWNQSLCADFHHTNSGMSTLNKTLMDRCGMEIKPVAVFDRKALDYRNRLLYEIVKIIWEV